MRSLLLAPIFALTLLSELSHAQQQRPIPPGIRQADQVDAQSERSLPPPLVGKAKINPIKLQREAAEVAELAQAVPALVNQANKGMLPKDLNQRLKRIEKLSKQLRTELTE